MTDSGKRKVKKGGSTRLSDKHSGGSAFDVDYSALASLEHEEGWIRVKNNIGTLFKKRVLEEPLEGLSADVEGLLAGKVFVSSIMVKSLVTILQVELEAMKDIVEKATVQDFYAVLCDQWIAYFGTIMPYVQGIFLPLDRVLAGRKMSLTVQKIGLAAFRDNLLLTAKVKKLLIQSIEVKGKTMLPRILQMVEIMKRIQTADKHERELDQIFSKTGL